MSQTLAYYKAQLNTVNNNAEYFSEASVTADLIHLMSIHNLWIAPLASIKNER